MSVGKYILIDPSECPARDELAGAIERLHKCAEILERLPSKKDPDPSAIRKTASFLELLYKDNRLKQSALSDEEETTMLENIEISKTKSKK